MTQPSDMGLTPQQLLQMAQQYSAQDQAAPPQIDPAAGMAHSAPQPSAAQYFAAQPMAAPAAPAAPTRIPFPQGAASGASPAGGVANPSLALLPGGGARPAGWNPTDKKTEATTSPFSEDTVAAQAGLLGAQGEQLTAQSNYDAIRAKAARAAGDQLGAFTSAQSADEASLREQQLKELYDKHHQIDAVLQDASHDRVDPMKWWKDDMSAGQKVLFGLGSALQGFGFGYTGRGVNPAQVIQERIAASVDAQKSAHATKIGTAEGLRSQLGDLEKMQGDQTSAALTLHAARLKSVMGQLDNSINDASTPYAQKLQAANIKVQLQKGLTDVLERYDEHNIGKITSSSAQKYSPATAVGAGAVGVTVTLADGTRKVIPIAMAKELNLLPKDQLEAQKTSAETRKTIAEADAAEAKAAGAKPGAAVKQLAETAKDVASTAYNPLRYVQGTDAYRQDLKNKDFASQLISVWHAQHPGIRITPEMKESVVGAYEPQPGDTSDTIQERVHLALKSLGGGQAAVDAGEGAEEQ